MFKVSWIRNNDGYMLYIGRTKFIDDDRFDLLPGNEGQADLSTSRGGVDAILRVRRVKDVDQGNFECQISTEPKLSKIFTLNVIGKLNGNISTSETLDVYIHQLFYSLKCEKPS